MIVLFLKNDIYITISNQLSLSYFTCVFTLSSSLFIFYIQNIKEKDFSKIIIKYFIYLKLGVEFYTVIEEIINSVYFNVKYILFIKILLLINR